MGAGRAEATQTPLMVDFLLRFDLGRQMNDQATGSVADPRVAITHFAHGEDSEALILYGLDGASAELRMVFRATRSTDRPFPGLIGEGVKLVIYG